MTESSVLATSPLHGDSHGSWGWNWKMIPLPGSDLGLNAGLCLHCPIKPLSWCSLGLWVAQPAAGWGTRPPSKALGGCRLPFPLTRPKTPLICTGHQRVLGGVSCCSRHAQLAQARAAHSRNPSGLSGQRTGRGVLLAGDLGDERAAEIRNSRETTGTAAPVLGVCFRAAQHPHPQHSRGSSHLPGSGPSLSGHCDGKAPEGPVKSLSLGLWPGWNALTRSCFEVRKE